MPSIPTSIFCGRIRGSDGQNYSVIRKGFKTVMDCSQPHEVISECEWYELQDGRKLEDFKDENGMSIAGQYRIAGTSVILTIKQ